jgi:hypothetical protein
MLAIFSGWRRPLESLSDDGMTIVADVETRCARTATRSPNRKRALEYLAAWGAVPITVIERDGACSIHAGKISGTVAARWWIDERMAAQVAREARSLAARDPDASTPPLRWRALRPS